METLYPRCAGIDVHKNSVVVCVRCAGPSGKATEQVCTFATMTADLLALSPRTARRLWTFARAGLRRDMEQANEPTS
jgi:hypothetical protein